ncbi:NADH-quinone oxidoreductase subunit C/D [compost metagenome]
MSDEKKLGGQPEVDATKVEKVDEAREQAKAGEAVSGGESQAKADGDAVSADIAGVVPSAGASDEEVPSAGTAGKDAPSELAPKVADAAEAGKPERPVREPRVSRAAQSADATAAEQEGPSDADKEAKVKAAAEARAARASARAGKTAEEGENAAPKEPSPNQPILDRLVAILKEKVGEDVIEQAFINERDAHLPYVFIRNELWNKAAQVMKDHEELSCDYLRNVSGIDMETHMEVAYHLLSLSHKRDYCVKVKTDREQPSIPSVTPVWPTANWNEREVFDLYGIDFPGHPDMRRIMMTDEWVGHPLRKDYEPLDPEV